METPLHSFLFPPQLAASLSLMETHTEPAKDLQPRAMYTWSKSSHNGRNDGKDAEELSHISRSVVSSTETLVERPTAIRPPSHIQLSGKDISVTPGRKHHQRSSTMQHLVVGFLSAFSSASLRCC